MITLIDIVIPQLHPLAKARSTSADIKEELDLPVPENQRFIYRQVDAVQTHSMQALHRRRKESLLLEGRRATRAYLHEASQVRQKQLQKTACP